MLRRQRGVARGRLRWLVLCASQKKEGEVKGRQRTRLEVRVWPGVCTGATPSSFSMVPSAAVRSQFKCVSYRTASRRRVLSRPQGAPGTGSAWCAAPGVTDRLRNYKQSTILLISAALHNLTHLQGHCADPVRHFASPPHTVRATSHSVSSRLADNGQRHGPWTPPLSRQGLSLAQRFRRCDRQALGRSLEGEGTAPVCDARSPPAEVARGGLARWTTTSSSTRMRRHSPAPASSVI